MKLISYVNLPATVVKPAFINFFAIKKSQGACLNLMIKCMSW